MQNRSVRLMPGARKHFFISNDEKDIPEKEKSGPPEKDKSVPHEKKKSIPSGKDQNVPPE